MNNYIVMDAISYLDADLLAKHLDKKEKLRDKSQSKRRINILKWSSIAACLCLAVVLSVILNPNLTNRPNVPGDVPGPAIGEKDDSNPTPGPTTNTPKPEQDGTSPRLYVTSFYSLDEYSSMVKVETVNVLGMLRPKVYEDPVLLVEFKVIEDYYKKIAPNTRITVPITMGKTVTNETMIKDLQTFINSADGFILYIGRVYGNDYVYGENDLKIEVNNITSKNNMIFNSVFLIKNEEIDESSVHELLDKYEIVYYQTQGIIGYSSFVSDKMPVAVFEENIRSLYQWYIASQQNTTEQETVDVGSTNDQPLGEETWAAENPDETYEPDVTCDCYDYTEDSQYYGGE